MITKLQSLWLALVLSLAAVCAIGGCVYFAALAAFGFRLKDFSRRVTG
jgi:putative peptidoglycan lipid II flippase